MPNDLLFGNADSSASNLLDYVKDVFVDVTLPATSNSGLTSTALTNPQSQYFADDDVPKFGVKTLYIKDYVLIQDRSLWISNKPTYQLIFDENFPAIRAYAFGNISFSEKIGQYQIDSPAQPVLNFKTVGDGIGITGVVRRVSFLVGGDTSATATGQLTVDGSTTATIDFSDLSANSNTTKVARFTPFVHAAANATKDIHDIRLTALQANTLKVIGIQVYFENTGANLDFSQGSTYNDKTKQTTTVGGTLAIPTYGSSLGGKALLYKNSSAAYVASALSATTMATIAQGTINTNLITVSTGTGASYPIGSGIVVSQGTSHYVGAVISVSTDTLTVGPTLPFGISGTLYRSWSAGTTQAINATLMSLYRTIDMSQVVSLSNAVFDASGKWAMFGSNVGVTLVDSVMSGLYLGASGYLQIDGRFAAAEMEFIGGGIFNATFSINGTPGWSVNEGQTGALKRTMFTNAGPGWNSVLMQPGSSLGAVAISKINLYELNRNIGITTGVLAELETLHSLVPRTAVNASLISLGTYRRVYPDQMYLKGGWVRSANIASPSGAEYQGASTNTFFRQEWYGKNFAIIGTPGTSGILTLDGVSIGVTFGLMQTATEGFHTLTYQHQAGTCVIRGFDFSSTYGQMKFVGQVAKAPYAVPVKKKRISQLRFIFGNGYGSTNTTIRRFLTLIESLGEDLTHNFGTTDSTNGLEITPLRRGKISMHYSDFRTNGGTTIGISKNSTGLGSSIASLPDLELMGIVTCTGANLTNGLTIEDQYARAGDIYRVQTDAATNAGSDSGVRLFITFETEETP